MDFGGGSIMITGVGRAGQVGEALAAAFAVTFISGQVIPVR